VTHRSHSEEDDFEEGAILMASRLPDPILAPVIPGPATLVRSSALLDWRGVLIEKHISQPGIRLGNTVDRQVIAMNCSSFSRGEHRAINGQFVPYSKTQGALTVFPRGPVPELRLKDETELIFCAFDDALISDIKDEIEGKLPAPLDFRSGLHDRALSQLLTLLFGELEPGNFSDKLYLQSIAQALTVRFLFLGDKLPSELTAAPPAFSPRRLSRVRELIDSRLHEAITLQELAKEGGYSRSHFLRMFQAATGVTPHRYVLNRRLERAQHLLNHPDLSIAEIAHLCGFSSQAHLTIAFKKVIGLPPGEYRRKL
jgi:AraC family transcriptional regulator